LQKNRSAEVARKELEQLRQRTRGYTHTYIEYASDYAHAGLYTEASSLLALALEHSRDVNPMVYYCLGYFAQKQNNDTECTTWYKKAAAVEPDYCFPNRIEDVTILQAAIAAHPED